MPYAAVCRKCKYFMLGETKPDIASKIDRHFKDVHNENPKPSPHSFNVNTDFEKNEVELMDLDHGNWYTFTSRLFCSNDYCIAVIVKKQYNWYKDEYSQKKLSSEFSDYFPENVFGR